MDTTREVSTDMAALEKRWESMPLASTGLENFSDLLSAAVADVTAVVRQTVEAAVNSNELPGAVPLDFTQSDEALAWQNLAASEIPQNTLAGTDNLR